MMKKTTAEAGCVLLFLAAATWLIAFTGADLAISGLFHIDGAWPVGGQFPWNFLYHLGRIPAITLAASGLVLALYGRFNPAWRAWRRYGVFLALLLALGPGLLVNSIFKDYWGRPRPRDVVELGGTKPFLHPWQPGTPHGGRSFPSGHSSGAFFMAAPYFAYRRTQRRRALLWLAGGLVFGVFMSIARITQGGHFLSDCVWAWGMVHLTGLILSSIMRLDREPSDAVRQGDVEDVQKILT